MAKFCGNIGYGMTVDKGYGVHEVETYERKFYGEFVRNTSSKQIDSGNLNDNIRITNEISIIADPFAVENFSNIKYLSIDGTKWKVTSVELVYPRLILTTGGEYND